jgi:prepilin-type N-terminal cleavage/methylation domain-containing protein
MRPGARAGQGGFSLVEVMVALSVFLLILVGIFQILEGSNKAFVSSERKVNVQQNARVAMDTMVRQIRMTGNFPENFDTNPGNDLGAGVTNLIQAASNTALAVAGDLDGTGTSNAFLFCLASTGLMRVKGAMGAAPSYSCANGDLLAERVTGLTFSYYDALNNPVPNPPNTPYLLDGQVFGVPPDFTNTAERAAVRRVVITLTAQEAVPGQQAQTYTLASDVRLRNP